MTKIGIVGGGIRGRLFHRALQGLEGVSVAGFVDTSPSVLARAGAETGAPTFTSLNALLDVSDGVIIATPDGAHFEATAAVIRRRLPVLVEKPLTTSLAEAKSIADLAVQHQADVFVGFENRFANVFRQAKQSVDDGAFGHLRSVYARLSDNRVVPLRMLSWAAQSSPAWFLMPHTLDIALWMTRANVVSVAADGTRGVLASLGVDTWDSISATMELDNGGMVVLEASWALPEAYPSLVDFRVELLGTEGSAVLDNTTQMLQTVTSKVDQPRTLASWNAGRLNGPAAWMVQTFARRTMGFDEKLPTIDDGVRVTAVLEAVHEALETRQRCWLEEVGS